MVLKILKSVQSFNIEDIYDEQLTKDDREEATLIRHSVRKGGDSNPKTANPKTSYWAVIYVLVN